jgi:excisionase family DNA binding protein
VLEELFGSSPPVDLAEHMLRTADVASVFEVSERTVASWAQKGQLNSMKMPGGQWRFPATAVRDALTSTRTPENEVSR